MTQSDRRKKTAFDFDMETEPSDGDESDESNTDRNLFIETDVDQSTDSDEEPAAASAKDKENTPCRNMQRVLRNTPSRMAKSITKKDTPMKRLGLESAKFDTNTPNTRALRRRNAINNALKKLEDEADSDESDAFIEFTSESESEADASGDENATPRRSKRASTTTPSKSVVKHSLPSAVRRVKQDSSDSESGMDDEKNVSGDESDTDATRAQIVMKRRTHQDYFQHQYEVNHLKTSNNTLADLNIPLLELKQYHDLLSQVPEKHVRERKELLKRYERQFDQWNFELVAGYSLLFYGVGDKRALLQKFVEEHCSVRQDHVITINGVFPGLSLRDVFVRVLSGVLGDTGEAYGSPVALAEAIGTLMSQTPQQRMFFLVHSLDGPPLRSAVSQQALAKLATFHNVHVIASVDHLSATLLWDNQMASQFQFVHHDLTTYEPFETEWLLSSIGNEASSILSCLNVGGFVKNVNGSQAMGDVRGMVFVLRSLTKNARDIFKVLIEHQLDQLSNNDQDADGTEDEDAMEHEEELGMTYQTFYRACYEKFLTASDMSFRVQLTEFRDHAMVVTRSNEDGNETFQIPLDSRGLMSLLEELI